jgi:hypothetical protein
MRKEGASGRFDQVAGAKLTSSSETLISRVEGKRSAPISHETSVFHSGFSSLGRGPCELRSKTNLPKDTGSAGKLQENDTNVLPSRRAVLVITSEDAEDWRSRMPQRDNGVTSSFIRFLAAWLVGLFVKTDPPRSKLAVATFRWTRAAALFAAIALIPALYNWLSPLPSSPSPPSLESNGASPVQETAEKAVPVEVVGTASPTINPSDRPNITNDQAVGTSVNKPPTPKPGGLLTLGVGS